MPPQKQEENFIVDGIGPLDAGMNSGLVPQLLKPNTTAMSTNATHRGGYIRNRPALRKINLNFSGDVALQSLFQQSLWQGASFFKSEYGAEGLVASIGGRLFELTPDGAGGALVKDRTIPTDPNSSGNAIAWLGQAERWMIINDGEKLPIFFDGATTRRSRGPAQLVGTVGVAFVVPAKNASVNITLTGNYTGPFNENIFIGGAFYQVNASGVGYKATIRNRSEPAGGVIPAGQLLIVRDNLIGLLATPSNPLCGSFGGGIPQCVYSLNITPPQNGTISGITQLIGARLSGETYFYGTAFGVNAFKVFGNFGPLPANTPIYNGYPHTTGIAGTLAAPFTIPAIGGDVEVTITQPFNGPLPQRMTINGGVYDIVAVNNTPVPTNTINATNVNDTAGNMVNPGVQLTTIPELGIGRMFAYGRGRVWYSLPDGRSFRAGDIVGGSSGSAAVNYRDAVLRETENTFLNGGGNFVVPGNIGDIRSMTFTANLDTSLGQGPLQVGTSTTIFSCDAPVDRTTWQNLTNPILTESLKGRGPLGQYGTILVNSDTLFREVQGLASLILARRDFDTWGNVPISREMQKVIEQDNNSLLENDTAIEFDNRVLYGCLPVRGPLGVFHQGVIAMNLDPVSSLRGKAPSIYDGLWTGLNVFQFVAGSFAGSARAFAFCYNSFHNRIELYEILPSAAENNFDNGGIPISWGFETASLFQNVKGKGTFDQVELLDGEIYLSEIRGIVNVQAWYRPDYSECWTPWTTFDICASNMDQTKAKQFRSRIGLGEPSPKACEPVNNRPFRIGASFQVRFQITGCCKLMGALFKASKSVETQFARPICTKLCDLSTADNPIIPCEPCADTGDCLRFPLLFYSLNNHQSYSNELLSFAVECPNGSTQTVYVPPGTINYTLPFPPGFEGPYPPLVLGCVSGGNVVREVPDNATQEQIDTLVDQMIKACARAYAESIVQCPVEVFNNEAVFYQMNCAEGETIAFAGTLPAWLSINTGNNRVIGAAGVFSATSTELATAAAQEAIDTWAAGQIQLGNLTCDAPSDICADGLGSLLDNVYGIDGYTDSMFDNPDSGSGNPAWDGLFSFWDDDIVNNGLSGWADAPSSGNLSMDGGGYCCNILAFVCVDEQITWRLSINPQVPLDDGAIWYGEKDGGDTPEGVYTRVSGSSAGPASVTVSQVPGTTSPITNNLSCIS